jgi:acetate kinase
LAQNSLAQFENILRNKATFEETDFAALGQGQPVVRLLPVTDKIRKYIGAYLAALGGAQAIIFGGGIGEDTSFVRARVLEDLAWCGLILDPARNERMINCKGGSQLMVRACMHM